MRVYVAGSSKEHERARAFMDRVRAIPNVEIVGDWTGSVEDARRSGVEHDGQLSRPHRAHVAHSCFSAVRSARVFVYLASPHPSEGRNAELGYALAWRDAERSLVPDPKRILVVGAAITAFAELADAFAETENVALALLTAWGAQ